MAAPKGQGGGAFNQDVERVRVFHRMHAAVCLLTGAYCMARRMTLVAHYMCLGVNICFIFLLPD